jgi:hypothetical protein
MEIRKNFETFKSGDVVRLKPGFPYVSRDLLTDEIYIIEKMIADAGVVTLKGMPYNKTFPDDAFELIHNGDMSGKEQ